MPETVLSMEQVLHELTFTGPILGHLQVVPDHKRPNSDELRVMVGVFKKKLQSNIPAMGSAFRKVIKDTVTKEAEESKTPDQGWSEL
jgi:hypothetical protein